MCVLACASHGRDDVAISSRQAHLPRSETQKIGVPGVLAQRVLHNAQALAGTAPMQQLARAPVERCAAFCHCLLRLRVTRPRPRRDHAALRASPAIAPRSRAHAEGEQEPGRVRHGMQTQRRAHRHRQSTSGHVGGRPPVAAGPRGADIVCFTPASSVLSCGELRRL